MNSAQEHIANTIPTIFFNIVSYLKNDKQQQRCYLPQMALAKWFFKECEEKIYFSHLGHLTRYTTIKIPSDINLDHKELGTD